MHAFVGLYAKASMHVCVRACLLIYFYLATRNSFPKVGTWKQMSCHVSLLFLSSCSNFLPFAVVPECTHQMIKLWDASDACGASYSAAPSRFDSVGFAREWVFQINVEMLAEGWRPSQLEFWAASASVVQGLFEAFQNMQRHPYKV